MRRKICFDWWQQWNPLRGARARPRSGRPQRGWWLRKTNFATNRHHSRWLRVQHLGHYSDSHHCCCCYAVTPLLRPRTAGCGRALRHCDPHPRPLHLCSVLRPCLPCAISRPERWTTTNTAHAGIHAPLWQLWHMCACLSSWASDRLWKSLEVRTPSAKVGKSERVRGEAPAPVYTVMRASSHHHTDSHRAREWQCITPTNKPALVCKPWWTRRLLRGHRSCSHSLKLRAHFVVEIAAPRWPRARTPPPQLARTRRIKERQILPTAELQSSYLARYCRDLS